MDKPVAAAPTGAKEKVEKQARQLAYDVRYKTKQSMAQKSGGRLDPAQVQKAYMSQLAKSPAPPAVKSRAKQMLMGEDYKKDLGKLVSDSAATALYKVFVEHHQKDANGNVIEHDGNPRPEEEIADDFASNSVEDINEEEKQYKVRVTDKKTSNSYVRMATRAKIGELRSNPNIASVEMTEYGSPTKSEKYKGKQTADAKKGKLAKKDYDGDGKIETGTQEYMGSRDKAIKKAMATRKEEYSWRDGFAELIEKKEKEKKITGEGVDNSKLIKVFPDEVKEQMMDKEEKPEMPKPNPQIASQQKKQAMLKKQVLMKKLQAVRAGAGSDITSSHELEGDMIEGKEESGYISNAAKTEVRNLRRFGKKGSATPTGYFGQGTSEKAKLAVKRGEEHKARRGVKTKGVMEGDEMKPENKTSENAGDVTFDAGGAIPTTIKAIGDPRELETAMKLKKTMLRASGLNMSHEPEGDMVEATKIDDKLRKDAKPIKGGGLYKSGMNKKVMGDRAVVARRNLNAAPKKGGMTDSMTAQAERQKVHQSKRGVKKGMGEAYVVSQSDKTGNTKAYQDMKAGKKNQITGEPLYKKADHLKENLVTIEKFNNVANINVKPSNYNSEKDLIKDILNK